MEKWITCKLSDIGEVVGGGTPSTQKDEYYGGNISWITPKDLAGYRFRYIEKGERSITEKGFMNSSAKKVPAGTVLFTSRAPIGYIAIAKKEICTNQGFKSVVPNDKVDNLFLFYLLNHYKDAITSMGSGTTFKEVSGGVMKNINVKIPEDVIYQRKIASILGAIDSKIELNIKLNDNLTDLMRNIFINWFIHFEPYLDHELDESILGLIPSGWRIDNIGNVCDVKGGKRLPKGINLTTEPNSHPYIRVRDMNNSQYLLMSDEYEFVDNETQKYIERYIVSEGDVIISIVGTIGLISKIHKSLEGANLTENCVKLTNVKQVTSDYLYIWLSSEYGQQSIKQMTVGAVQAKLPIKNIQDIKIIIPPGDVIDKFQEVINPITYQIQNNLSQNENMKRMRDTLLPKLMSGELNLDEL